ncbi:FtsX-like permease family protein [Marivita hallyeonensis]|uniref:Putative ABC transport system permease protein n=1 Tax=Marivita hallyeonensis TaxID=996342 RepID=A0A1M5VJH7_9RHOB|nr:FtsX-like permease family protein [Marivita hallyeonensis]SHH75409.1 putative ABC transport system permease protein [Marivita hallyeonensis]
MTLTVFTALLSHWRRNWLQFFALIAGLALATALWSGVQAINAEARASYDAAAATLGEGQFDQLVPRAGGTVPQDTYVALRRAGWQVSPILEGRLDADRGRVRVLGIDPLTAPGTMAPVAMNADADLGAFLEGELVFANAETADRLEGQIPQRILIDEGIAPGIAVTDIGAAQRLLEADGQLSRLTLARVQPMGLPPLSAVAPDLTRQPAQDAGANRLTDSFHLNLTAFGLLSFAVGIFIVHGTISLAFEQRRGMVRTLRALGVPLRTLVVLTIAELVVFAVLAGAVGVALGYVMASVLLPNVAATVQGLYGAQVAGTLQLRPEWWVSGMAIALGGTAIAAAGALWKIAHMSILESARPRAWSVASGSGATRLGAVALGLFGLGAGIAIWGQGLLLSFALLACVLIGAALILPLMLRSAVGLAERLSTTVIWQWFWADTRQQVPGLSLALMALLLATAANVGVSTMVSSFRVTFVDFLDQRLAPELFVQIEDEARSAEVETVLRNEAREVLPLLSVETEIAGVPSDLFGVRVGPTYRENWLFLDRSGDVWSQVADEDAVVVSEQLARRAGLWVGDPVRVAPDVTLPIAGIVADYGNPLGQAVMSETLFRSIYPDQIATQFGVRTEDPEALTRILLDDLGLPPAAVIDQARIKAFSLSVFERTFTITGALNVLTLGVAAFAILMSLLTLASLRVPQLAPVWALGMTRRDLGRLELLRSVILALLTTLLAIPLGLLLAWVLLAYVNVEAFGWQLPMYLFPGHYAVLSLFAIVAAAVAALWPAFRLSRTPPSSLLKVFANDR